jgi:aryl-alcohol dehydrogenase-like predicted oxidoreductase
LGLGTVQFGLDYGISNAAGRVPIDEVTHILQAAAESGMRVLDTFRWHTKTREEAR